MKKLLLILISIFLITLGGCVKKSKDTDKISVVTSIMPIGSMVNYIGSGKVDVTTLVPAGFTPHGYELKPQQIIDIEKSDIIFSVGIESIDGFLTKKLGNNDKNITLSSGIELINLNSLNKEHHEEEHHEEEHHEEEHHHGNVDPHIWLGIDESKQIAENITKQLSILDPENTDYYTQNLESFKNTIDLKVQGFKEKINGKTANKFLISHNPYNYLLLDLGIDLDNKIVFNKNILKQVGAKEYKKINDTISNEGVDIIFKEPQFETKGLDNLASKYNMTVLNVDPLGTNNNADEYFNMLDNNLKSFSNIYE